MPGDRRAPVVTDHDRLVGAERVHDPDHVAGQMEERIGLDRLGPVGLPIAAHVGRDGMIAGLGQRLELMAPRIPGFGPAVAEEDERPLACLGDVDAKAVRLDEPMGDFGHGVPFSIEPREPSSGPSGHLPPEVFARGQALPPEGEGTPLSPGHGGDAAIGRPGGRPSFDGLWRQGEGKTARPNFIKL